MQTPKSEVETEVKPITSKKAIIVNLAILGVVFLALILYLIFGGDKSYLDLTVADFKLRWIWMAVFLMGCYLIGEVVSLTIAIKMAGGELPLDARVAVSSLGQLYGTITPMATGAQPAQMYYLSRFGIPVGKSAFALLAKFVIYQIVLTLFALLVLILRFEYFSRSYGSLALIALPAFTLHVLIVLALVGMMVSPKISLALATPFVNLYGKFKKSVDVDEIKQKVEKEIHSFAADAKTIRKHRWGIAGISLVTLVQLLCYYIIPACIILALKIPITDLITVVAAAAFVIMIQTAMPLPGGSGAAEGGFAAFFSLMFPNSTSVVIALLLWRVITLILPVIFGIPFMFLVEKLIAKFKVNNQE